MYGILIHNALMKRFLALFKGKTFIHLYLVVSTLKGQRVESMSLTGN